MSYQFQEIENKIIKFWKENRVFEKSLEKEGKNFVFFEGPPTANAKPGVHHVLARVFKDLICRYKTMRGYRVLRKAGWDTHGLPVELEIEKKLGLKSKKDIEEYGIDKFNQECKKSVWQYEQEWRNLTERIGFWLDMDNPYITYDPFYIETVWWIIKQISEKGLLYQGYKVVPYCPRCGTALSSHEVAQGYKRIREPAIYVKFQISDSDLQTLSQKLKILPQPLPSPLNKKTSIQNEKLKINFLVWTTTPWTLPANVAIAVNPELDYVLVKLNEEYLILAKTRIEVLEGGYEIIKEFKGKELIGLSYEPLFSSEEVSFKDFNLEKAYKILGADFVNLEEGTGLVHIAPAFGEEDLDLIKKEIPEIAENLPQPVDCSGIFTSEVKKWSGIFVKDADPQIIDFLKQQNKLFKVEEYEHDYPFCWRCKTPLLYYAQKSWFIRTSKIKEKLIENNQQINWIPPHIKEGRFGEWLKDLKDWALSRTRFWGTPMPVWQCEKCDHQIVIGSREDLLKQKFSTNEYFIIRHGEAENITKGIYSSFPEKTELPLTKKGEKQIQEVAEKLKEEQIDLIVSSDILRCKQTAELIGKKLGIQPIFDPRLREIDQGELNGQTKEEARKFWDPQGKLDALQFTLARINKPAPGGESFADVRVRVLDFLKEIEKQYQGKKILIVSHESPLLMLETATKGLTHKETAEYRIQNPLHVGELRKIEFKQFPYNQNGELDFHKPYVDEVQFFCEKCGGLMRRVPEVLDCWCDSGSMPFAQWHYPFENKELIDERKQFPADYICEGIDQTRGWFYTLLAISTLLGFEAPYKNVIALGHVLDENGEKMSKSKGNVVDPWKMVEKYGADALRWYFYTVNQPGDSKLFSEKDVDQALKKFIMTFWNCYVFFGTYVPKKEILNPKSQIPNKFQILNSKHVLDRWILSKLNNLISDVTERLDNYDITGAARLIDDFVINDLSLWYIRRSRKRFQNPVNDVELEQATSVLGFVIDNIARLIAPFTPFISDYIYQELGNESSVHLAEWPEPDEKLIDEVLEVEMEKIRKIVKVGLRLRDRAGIKVRQPLLKLEINDQKLKGKEGLLQLIKEELNIKEVKIVEKPTEGENWIKEQEGELEMSLNTEITPELKEEGIVREVIRGIQDLRKKTRCLPENMIEVYFQTKSKEFVFAKKEMPFDAEREHKVNGEKIWIGIKKL